MSRFFQAIICLIITSLFCFSFLFTIKHSGEHRATERGETLSELTRDTDESKSKEKQELVMQEIESARIKSAIYTGCKETDEKFFQKHYGACSVR